METHVVPVIDLCVCVCVCVSCETIRNFSRVSFRLNQVFIYFLIVVVLFVSALCHGIVWGVTHIWGIDVDLDFENA